MMEPSDEETIEANDGAMRPPDSVRPLKAGGNEKSISINYAHNHDHRQVELDAENQDTSTPFVTGMRVGHESSGTPNIILPSRNRGKSKLNVIENEEEEDGDEENTLTADAQVMLEQASSTLGIATNPETSTGEPKASPEEPDAPIAAVQSRTLHVKKFAKRLDHYGPIRKDDLPDGNVRAELEVAKEYNVRAVVVRPDCVKLACEVLADTDIIVCAIIGFPFTFDESVEGRCREAVEAIKDGAEEIELIPCHHLMVFRQWANVYWEVSMIHGVVKDLKATMNVLFEDNLLQFRDRYDMGRLCGQSDVPCVGVWPGTSEALQDDYTSRKKLAKHIYQLRHGLAGRSLAKVAYALYDIEDAVFLLASGVDRIGTIDIAIIMEEAAGWADLETPLEVRVGDCLYKVTFKKDDGDYE
ncbi:hypothetical protein BKA67DRAFT_678579 [Truncatella angustata]|uniref:Deoxyribose-phosphate aldolase n=1 Tax=Truncatella angustata TaxID=152316 RepID=A0A9P8UJV1_9PEZI|nr:uncharacterized protein BKA67DRAFT_678579 [Truncatella angustata]KAH6653338.1 hypothetical protein BKA67DRAFT_678579 [Truncatella angustata]KAH8196387.1 hypothetical protein TruAng_009437 [Truncatella angustata]